MYTSTLANSRKFMELEVCQCCHGLAADITG